MWGFLFFASFFDAKMTLDFARMAAAQEKGVAKTLEEDASAKELAKHEANPIMREAIEDGVSTFLIWKLALVPFLAFLLFIVARSHRLAWGGFVGLTVVHIGLTIMHLVITKPLLS